MKLLAKALFLLSVPLLLSSCICFENPLGDNSFTDTRLAGVWHGKVQDNDEYLHIFNLPDGKSLKLIRVTHINVGGIENHEVLEMYPTASTRFRYLNLKINCPGATANAPEKQGWIFARYEISSQNELSVSLIDYESLKAALDKKSLHGKAWETSWSANAQIDDDSKKLLEFVDSNEAAFKPYGVFRHVVDAAPNAAVKN